MPDWSGFDQQQQGGGPAPAPQQSGLLTGPARSSGGPDWSGFDQQAGGSSAPAGGQWGGFDQQMGLAPGGGNAGPQPAKGGGGWWGGLSRNLQNLGNLTYAMGTTPVHWAVGAGENIVNDVSKLGNVTVGTPETHLGGPTESPDTGLVSKLPAQTMVGSFQQTLGDVAHPSRFGTAYQQGMLPSVLARDVANAAIVAGPVAKGVGFAADAAAETAASQAAAEAAAAGADEAAQAAAGQAARQAAQGSTLGRAASVTSAANRGVAMGANAPVSLPLAGIKAGLGALSDRVPAIANLAETMSQRMQARRLITDTSAEATVPGKQAAAVYKEQSALLPDPNMQAASTLVRQGEAGALQPLAGLPPDVLARIAAENFPQGRLAGEAPVTGEALQAALGHVSGTLPAEQSALLEQYGQAGNRLDQPRNANYEQAAQAGPIPPDALLREHGMTRQPNPAQLGNEPLPNVVNERIKPLLARQATAEAQAGRLAPLGETARASIDTARAALTDLRTAQAEERAAATALQDPEGRLTAQQQGDLRAAANTAAARVEEARQRYQQATGAQPAGARAQAVEYEQAQRRAQRLGLGVDKARTAAETSMGAAPARLRPALGLARGAADTLERMAVEAEQKGQPEVAATLREHAVQLPTDLAALAERGVSDQAQHLQGGLPPDYKTPPSLSGPGQKLPTVRKLASERQRETTVMGRSAREQALKNAETGRQTILNQSAQLFADKFARAGSDIAPGLKGADLLQAARAERGKLVPWDPRSPFQTVPVDQIGPDTRFIPQHLYSEFGSHFNRHTPGALAVFDTLTRELRTLPKIALNPAFHVAHIIGHALQDVAGEGLGVLNPHLISQAWRDYQAGDIPESVMGGRGGGLLGTNELRGVPGKTENPLSHIANASYRLLQRTSDLSHAVVYEHALGRGLGEEAAKTQALRVAGDFGNLSSAEAGFARRVMPAYAFARHITKLALTLPVTNPVRIAWMLHLGDMYGTPQAGLPSFDKGAVKLPGTNKYSPIGFLTNPFGYAAGLTSNPAGDIASGLNPAIKLGLAAFGDKSNTKGINPLTHPGTPNTLHSLLAPSTLHELPYFVSQETPQGKLIQALLSGPPVKRYDTGQPKRGRTAGPAPYNGPGPLLRSLIGVPQNEYLTDSKGRRIP